jgi:hypothetical protein
LMAIIEFKTEPINRDIVLFIDSLSPEETSRQFAVLAAQHIDDAKRINVRVLGREPPSTTYVDGRARAPLATVRPNGVIFTEFELLIDVLVFITEMLIKFSPVGRKPDRRPGHPGLYKRSHILLADGVEIDVLTPSLVPQLAVADEYVFINTLPYARKIEHGLSPQAPDGVYQAVANVARRRYNKIAKIFFTYRTIFEGERNPAIIVRMG